MKKKMTAKQLANLKPQKAGEPSHNPLGRNNPELQKIRRLTAFELQETASLILNKDKAELKKLLKAKSGVSVNTQMVVAIALAAVTYADEKKANAIWDRTVGKVSEKLQMFGPDDDPDKSELTPEEKAAIVKKNLDKLGLTEDE